MSPELISEVRREVAEERAARYATQAAARAKANSDFWAKQVVEKATEHATLETEELINKCKVVGKAGLVIGGVVIIGYGIYKVTPKVKSWWYERKQTSKMKIPLDKKSV